MSPVPAPAFTVAGGEITIDAMLLTPKSAPPPRPLAVSCDIIREMNASGELPAIMRANHKRAI